MYIGVLEQHFPDGFACTLDPNGDSYKLSVANESGIWFPIFDRCDDIANVRNPYTCYDYNALGLDFGLEPWDGVNLEQYRSRLATYVYTPDRTGSDDDIEKVLHDSGFVDAVYVKNNNLNDPRPWAESTPNMVAGNDSAVAGDDTAFAGYSGYEVLANGDIKNGDGNELGYRIGSDSGYWGYVDFIAGGVTYDGSGNIVSLVPLIVDKADKAVFKRLILRTKPLHCWVVLVVDYVDVGVIVQTGDPNDDVVSMSGDVNDDVISQLGA